MEIIKRLFIRDYQLFCSQSAHKKSKHPPWTKGDLVKAIRKKKIMWKKVKKSSDPAMMEKFRKFRQNIKMWVRSERKHYLNDIAHNVQPNSKRFWSFFSFKDKKKPECARDLPGHEFKLHNSVSSVGPRAEQSEPPNCAGGLVHERDLTRLPPPQVRSHSLQRLHVPYMPLTAER